MPSPCPPRPTVVLVDDDAGVRQALRYMLEIEGFEVVSLKTGEALLQQDLPQSESCLVIDQVLPGISGIEALEVLRERQIGLPAIVITSAPDARLRARVLMANARLIEKPLLNDLLTGLIRELI